MEAQVVRDATGRALFLEADPNVVDTLLALLRAPLGAVLQAARAGVPAQGEPGARPAALSNLAVSASELRQAVLARPKKDVVPEVLDVKGLCLETHPRLAEPAEPAMCLLCMKACGVNHTSYGCQRTSGTCKQCGGEASTALCSNHRVGLCCRNSYFRQNLNSWQFCVKCVKAGSSRAMSSVAVCGKCGQQKRGCPSCRLCDLCGAQEAGFRLDGTAESRTDAGCGVQADCKETVRFLVTNALDVYESSAVQAFQILAAAGAMSLEGLQYEKVRITPAVLATLLGNALCHSSQVLEMTFPGPPAPGEADEAGSERTEGSFEVLSQPRPDEGAEAGGGSGLTSVGGDLVGGDAGKSVGERVRGRKGMKHRGR